MLVRLFVLVGGLIVLALTAALVGPYFVDWTPYRGDFEREASRILGREVKVAGDATARLLPFPSVTFSDLRVAGADGAPAMTVDRFSMDAELAPFMSGTILIFDMRLERPRATVVVAGNGAVDWALRPSSPVGERHITLEKLTVSDGEITVKHGPSGRDHVVSDIDADISAKSLEGPWRFAGTAELDGMRTALSVTSGVVGDDGAIRLRIEANPVGLPLALESDGDAKLEDGRLVYAGTFKLNADLPGSVAAAEANAPKPPPAYRVGGAFRLDHSEIRAEEYRFETGSLEDPYVAEGNAALAFGDAPSFRIVADGAQVQVDRALGKQKDDVPTVATAPTLDDRVGVLRDFLGVLPRPTIPGTVEVNLPAVVAGDTTIRQVKLSAEPAPTGWAVKSLAAQLPGRTTLEASGLLSTGADFGFVGSLLLAVGQPSGFAAWLSSDIDEAIRKLPAAGFLAKVDLTQTRQRFDNLELILGASRFRGSIESAEPSDARPTVTIDLDGGALDLDGLSALSALFVSETGAYRLGARDIDLGVKAGPVTVGGLTAGRVDTALRIREDGIEIDRLALSDLAGAAVSATGTLHDLGGDPSGKLDLSVVSADLAPLIDAVAAAYPANPAARALKQRADAFTALFADASIDVVASFGEKAKTTTLTAKGAAGGSTFTLAASTQGALTPDIATMPLSLSFSAKNPDAAALFALYGVPALPLGLAGAADTVVTARGKLSEGMRARIILTGQSADLSFDGTVRHNGVDGLSMNGGLGIDASDVEPWLATTGLSLPGMGYGLPAKLTAKADLTNDMLILSGLTGSLADQAISGDINASIKAGRPHLAGGLDLAHFDLTLLAAIVLGDGVLGEAALPTDAEAVFDAAARLPISVDLDMAVGELGLGGEITIADALFKARLDDGGLRVSDLTGQFLGGTLKGLADLRNTDGSAVLSTQATLSGASLPALLPNAGLSGGIDFSANLTASGKSIAGLAAALAGSGTAALREVSVHGLDPGALPALLAKADAIGRNIDGEAVQGFAPSLAGDGIFSAGSPEFVFTIANGVLRAPPLRIDTPAATVTAEPRADLARGTVGLSGEIAYHAGDDALAGSVPAVEFSAEGPVGAVTGQFGTAQLTQFLTQRALEREQARVEAMQAALLEKQRLRREVAYYSGREDERRRVAEETERAEREARALADQERIRLEAEDAARRAAEVEAEERRRESEQAPVPSPDAIEREPLASDPAVQGEAEPSLTNPSTIFQALGDAFSGSKVPREIAPIR